MQTQHLVWALVVFLSLSFTLADAQDQVWVGYVTDTHCGTNCQVTKNMMPVQCIRRCVKERSKYGLCLAVKCTVCFRQACGTLVQKRAVIQDSRTMSANSGCTSKEGNPCHLRRHNRSHG
jgi:hypothetical protein